MSLGDFPSFLCYFLVFHTDEEKCWANRYEASHSSENVLPNCPAKMLYSFAQTHTVCKCNINDTIQPAWVVWMTTIFYYIIEIKWNLRVFF